MLQPKPRTTRIYFPLTEEYEVLKSLKEDRICFGTDGPFWDSGDILLRVKKVANLR